MTEEVRAVLLNTHTRWPDSIQMEVWTFTFCHVVQQLHITPRCDMRYRTPDEMFVGINHQKYAKDHFKNSHPFRCPSYVLNDKL